MAVLKRNKLYHFSRKLAAWAGQIERGQIQLMDLHYEKGGQIRYHIIERDGSVKTNLPPEAEWDAPEGGGQFHGDG